MGVELSGRAVFVRGVVSFLVLYLGVFAIFVAQDLATGMWHRDLCVPFAFIADPFAWPIELAVPIVSWWVSRRSARMWPHIVVGALAAGAVYEIGLMVLRSMFPS